MRNSVQITKALKQTYEIESMKTNQTFASKMYTSLPPQHLNKKILNQSEKLKIVQQQLSTERRSCQQYRSMYEDAQKQTIFFKQKLRQEIEHNHIMEEDYNAFNVQTQNIIQMILSFEQKNNIYNFSDKKQLLFAIGSDRSCLKVLNVIKDKVQNLINLFQEMNSSQNFKGEISIQEHKISQLQEQLNFAQNQKRILKSYIQSLQNQKINLKIILDKTIKKTFKYKLKSQLTDDIVQEVQRLISTQNSVDFLQNKSFNYGNVNYLKDKF